MASAARSCPDSAGIGGVPATEAAVQARGTTLAFVAVYGITAILAVAYAAFFSWYSIQRYDAFLMHALDMSNMDQAVWHTLHGQPFYFDTMRAHLPKEAWGTTTRLSFHVEPILLPLSLLYLIHAGPETLIVAQAAIVALCAPAAARLALRLTRSSLLAIAAAVAYLLSPTLQAATLYEFHAVTLVAPLLLWAIVFAEERRYAPFVLCSVAAICCKEEIGLVVAMLCLWLWWRGGDRRVALALGIAGVCWSALALGVIVPHFARGSSAYWQRYINAADAKGRTSSGAGGLLSYWLRHPGTPFLQLLWEPKLSMLHRLYVQDGYLGLFGLPMLLVSLPSLAIIVFSTDQHMYGGLGHYSAELVPIGVAAAVYGVAFLTRFAEHCNWSAARLVPTLCALWLLGFALCNERFNGFTPLAASYAAPQITAHDRLGQRLLRLIPPNATVSAMDQLSPHLGDRQHSYLFPDVEDAEYVALDVTTNANPGTADDPDQLTPNGDQERGAMALLASRHYRILAADDGYLILRRTARPLAQAPVLPPRFFTFMFGSAGRPLRSLARMGSYLELENVQIERREQVNLRVPDLILTTTWRVLRPLPAGLQMHILQTDTQGHIHNDFSDQVAIDWLSPRRWPVGALVRIRSRQLSIVNIDPGSVSFRVLFNQATGSGQDPAFAPRLMGDEQGRDLAILGGALQVARIPITF